MTISTARALIAACLAEPDEDGPRLAYADWLDEQPSRICDVCATGIIHREDAENIYSAPQCRHCHGSVADDFHARWAELIRVQCEVAGHSGCDWKTKHKSAGYVDCKQWNDLLGEGRVMTWCQECLRRNELVAREKQLLPTLRARLMPRCPGYHGDGHGWEDCPLCGKHPNPAYGICPRDIVRGFPVLAVPLLECGKEEGGKWVVADWIAAARERGATAEPTGVEPEYVAVGRWGWSNTAPWGIGSLPPSLFLLLQGAFYNDGRVARYDSPAAAVAALGRAVMGITSGSSGESSAC